MKEKPPEAGKITLRELFRRKRRIAAPVEGRVVRYLLLHTFLALVILAGTTLFFLYSPVKRIEYPLLDLFFKIRPALTVHPDLAVIEIADDGVEAFGRWPWPRHYHAVLIHLLKEWGAKGVVFDVLFNEESDRFEDGAMEAALGEGPPVYLPVVLEGEPGVGKWHLPIPRFGSLVRGLGHINVPPDSDGVTRRVRGVLESEGTEYPYLGLRVAYDALGKDWREEADKSLLVNWAGPWTRSFAHYSYIDLVKSYYAVKRGDPPVVKPEAIQGKILLVGLTATGHADLKATPMESVAPGLSVLASIVNSVLTGRFVVPASVRMNTLCLVAVGLAGILFLVPFRGFVSLLAILAVSAGWLCAAFLLFWQRGIWVYGVQPVLGLLLLFVFSALYSLRVGDKERRELAQLAIRDGLTGLFVIRHFRSLLNEAVRTAKDRGEALSVILLDLDDFKQINDTYGHPAGDAVLRDVAAVIQTHIRHERTPGEIDSVARYGGEEFIVMLRNCTLEDAAEKVAERIRRKVEENPYPWKGRSIPVSVSAGVAVLHEGETVPDPMVLRADQALYLAKQKGKNRVCSEAELGSGLDI
jgi:diguanylate cyclase (GGDEF)-like protein